MKIGIAGLGIMGATLAERLLDMNANVIVTNRTQQKAEHALARGAAWAASPADLARQCDIVITLVKDPGAVNEVVHGASGILAALSPKSIHCDMSTIGPAAAAKLADEYAAAGKQFVYAPVLGSKAQIAQGTLLVFAGGKPAAIDACRSAWELFASRVWTFDSAEQAATVKLSCNMMIAHMILGLGQSLLFAKKNGVEPSTVLEIIQASNLASAMYGSKGKTLIERSFQANFVVDNMLKDLNLATDAGLEAQAPLPFASLAREMFISASAMGYGNEDYSAAVKVLESLTGAALDSGNV